MKSKISQAYGTVIDTVETREVDDPSHMSELYDDEYDDTYDANNVGAGDADSADELTNRRSGLYLLHWLLILKQFIMLWAIFVTMVDCH